MRYLAALYAACLLAGCSPDHGARNQSQEARPAPVTTSQAQPASIDPPAEFLLEAAANDFHAHRPPYPTRFRDVRVGHIVTPDGTKQYMLCGQFLPEQEKGKTEWTPFVTIKTSDYEQWLGVQAASFCEQSSIIWEDQKDLSTSLQSQLDSLR
jgi:hypothetical protein